MYIVNEDKSIYVTRGDIAFIHVSIDNNGKPYTFQVGEVLRLKVYGKKNCEDVVLQKDFPVTAITQEMILFLGENDTKIGDVISKPKDYWYEVELNPYDDPQTVIGYDEDGAKLFKLFPEGADVPEYVPEPEAVKIIDEELDMTSMRPVQNQAIARAFANLQDGYQRTHDAVAALHVTPQMFGAICDGKSDDTEALQMALDFFEGKAGEVFLPQGQYRITAPLTIKSNIQLHGVSSAKYGRYDSDIPSTVIFYDGESVIGSVIKYDRDGSTVFGGGIYNLSIDGREKADYIVNLSKAGRVTIANNSIVKSLKAGVYIKNAYENIIKENWFGYNKENAIILDANANANIVRDNAIALSDESSGILLTGCNGNVISGNMIEGGFGSSVGIHAAAASFTTQNIIAENRIEFESHRYEGQTEGICILIGAEGSTIKPNKNYVNGNAVFNQVIIASGETPEYNRKNEFADYGLGTISDFYDSHALNSNAKMVVSGGALESYKFIDDGFGFSDNAGGAKITLKSAVYTYPVVYQAINAKDLRGEDIALSCMMKCNNRKVSVGIEFYKNGTGDTWGKFGTNISATRKLPFEVGSYQLVQMMDEVPIDCDTVVIVFNFGTTGQIPPDTDVDVKWCKLTRRATWK